jgi:hypothetical protein
MPPPPGKQDSLGAILRELLKAISRLSRDSAFGRRTGEGRPSFGQSGGPCPEPGHLH